MVVALLAAGEDRPVLLLVQEPPALRVGRGKDHLARIVLHQTLEERGVGRPAGRRRERLYAAAHQLLEGDVGVVVPLDQHVVVPGGDVRRHLEPLRAERLLSPVHETGIARPVAEVGAGRLVGIVERRRLLVVVVVLDAGVLVIRIEGTGKDLRPAERVVVVQVAAAAVGPHGPTLEQSQDPLCLVPLLVVREVTSEDGVRQARPPAPGLAHRASEELVHLADRHLDPMRDQRLLRTPGGGCGSRGVGIEELDAGRRLLVGELEVA